LSKNVRHLMDIYWPGGLTIICPCKINATPPLVRGRSSTLGVRMPDHELTLKLIEGIGVPILGPSANFHGFPTPYRFNELDPELIKLADYVVPGETKTKAASTVIDCSVTPWKILRQGSVEVKQI
ncbi:MAG: L-threonylcarbamoyladenylate synthase, partial [Patescibacteria group bacterium]